MRNLLRRARKSAGDLLVHAAPETRHVTHQFGDVGLEVMVDEGDGEAEQHRQRGQIAPEHPPDREPLAPCRGRLLYPGEEIVSAEENDQEANQRYGQERDTRLRESHDGAGPASLHHLLDGRKDIGTDGDAGEEQEIDVEDTPAAGRVVTQKLDREQRQSEHGQDRTDEQHSAGGSICAPTE